MVDLGAAMNIISVEVMKELGLKVDTTYGKFYAMDKRLVLIVGMVKNVDFRFPACPDIS